VQTVEGDRHQTIRFDQDVTFLNSDHLRQAIFGAINGGARSVTVAFGDEAFLDSSGIGALADGCRFARGAGAELCLSTLSPAIERVLQMSGFARIFGLQVLQPEPAAKTPKPGVTLQNIDWQITESAARSHPEMISRLREMATEVAREAGMDECGIGEVRIAVGEALTNALKHGSPRGPKDKIRLRCLCCPSAVVVEVCDGGNPFDFDGVPTPNPDDLAENGMGIYLMKQAMDEVEFRRTEEGNIVRMVKWLPDRPRHAALRLRTFDDIEPSDS
jgi:serine/threonine-protein kinase RsbW